MKVEREVKREVERKRLIKGLGVEITQLQNSLFLVQYYTHIFVTDLHVAT